MKRSEINAVIREAQVFFEINNWILPPNPKWDVTDFGLGNFAEFGLVLVNLTEEPEYCEKIMYARRGMKTPAHAHKNKKEDIIVRQGILAIHVWNSVPDDEEEEGSFEMKINGNMQSLENGDIIELQPGERLTIEPEIYHKFYPLSNQCMIGEVSTANDDINDNFFVNKDIGRYASIEEDETPIVQLISDK